MILGQKCKTIRKETLKNSNLNPRETYLAHISMELQIVLNDIPSFATISANTSDRFSSFFDIAEK